MIFPVGFPVDGLCGNQRQAAHMVGRLAKAAQDVVHFSCAARVFHMVIPAFSGARTCPTVKQGNGLEAVMEGNWAPIGELAKRLVEKQGRGK